MPRLRAWLLGIVAVLLVLSPPPLGAQADLHAPFDHVLDTYVRDGYVYYRALEKERGGLDRYVASLNVPRARVDAWPKADQEAFWVNAYNAIVLRTVINAYPIHGKRPDYPANSILQIPGAFDTIRHQVGGRSLTLDQIEKDVIAGFGDARLLLALSRGAIGATRLHSEAYEGDRLEQQLVQVTRECATQPRCVDVDATSGQMTVTPLVSWRDTVFIDSFAAKGQGRWANRSPIERAVAAMVYPYLFADEQRFLEADTFRMQYGRFDWRLNDLTNGVPN